MDLSVLKQLLKQAAKNVVYYNNLFQEKNIDPDNIKSYSDFCSIPITTKKDLQKNPMACISNQFCIEKLEERKTSGSTGQVFTIYWDKIDLLKSNYELWRYRYNNFHIKPSDKVLQFHPFLTINKCIENPTIYLISPNKLSFSWINLPDNYALFYRKMMEFQPKWIFSPVNALFLLSNYILKNNLSSPSSIQYIEVIGEELSDSCRDFIHKAFNSPVVGQYGSRETNGIAIECRNKNLHCIEKNVFLEIVDENDKPVKEGVEGYIVLTSLKNNAMPIIRYKIGDVGRLISGSYCSCGNSSAIIQITRGRITDNIELKNARSVSAVVFWYAVQKINTKYDMPILQFQIVQTNVYSFKLYLNINHNFNNKKEYLLQDFFAIIGEYGLIDDYIKWDVEFTDEIQIDKTGKLRYFIKMEHSCNEIK